MFSGIVSAMGRVEQTPSPEAPMVLAHPPEWGGLAVGDSLAVNGCCLTAITVAPDRVTVEVIPESVRRTALGDLTVGSRVNLEAALRLSDRVGGHLVSGHVDATGTVAALRQELNALWVDIEAPEAVGRYCVPQGSIAVDGCSLTLVAVEDAPGVGALLRVSLIPHTVAVTAAAGYRVGQRVNLEADLIAKLVERLAAPHLHGRRGPEEARL